MIGSSPELPPALLLTFDDAPSPEVRRELGRGIEDAHARTVPMDARRFALLVRDPDQQLVAGLGAVLSWRWMFVDSLWVDEAWRGQGVGRALLARAERHAVDGGCHAAWLDTFQARDFYTQCGYRVFGELEDYPGWQVRYFMRKRLIAEVEDNIIQVEVKY